jgi:hypothetical protein
MHCIDFLSIVSSPFELLNNKNRCDIKNDAQIELDNYSQKTPVETICSTTDTTLNNEKMCVTENDNNIDNVQVKLNDCSQKTPTETICSTAELTCLNNVRVKLDDHINKNNDQTPKKELTISEFINICNRTFKMIYLNT